MAKAIVSVYGYSENIVPGNNPWEQVVSDRFDGAVGIARFLKSHNIDVDMYISGGTVSNKTGKVEADAMHDLLKKRYTNLEKIIDEVVLDKESKNTQDNVNKISSYAKGVGADSVFGVSSRDHVGRIITQLGYLTDLPDLTIGVFASKGSYSINGSNGIQPMILEPPFFGQDNPKELQGMYSKLFKLTPYQKVEVGREIVKRVDSNSNTK
ncbi:MAG: YdcF family protein [Candidatus Parvarchaeota archaeon]|nr:YdcF family protein [Candidatus Parvarchaeota archaeon]